MKDPEKGTIAYDLDFLSKYDSGLVVLQSEQQGPVVVVSPKYQAKVFTSSVGSNSEPSFGWINYSFFESGKHDPHMQAYGGESRMWLGPEGGQYSIFFPPESEFTFENWKTPAPIDSEPWDLISKSEASVKMSKKTSLVSYSDISFDIEMSRTVSLLGNEKIVEQIGDLEIDKFKVVGYETINEIKNVGSQVWDQDSGSVCIWILDMFPPSDKTVVLVPYNENTDRMPIMKSDYFGKVPENRLQADKGIIMFRADGKERGKIGVPPFRSTPLAGSIDLENNVLTVVQFNIDSTAKYMNSGWEIHEDPYSGDAINSYNDGPLENGEQMGPFYELESVSPAAFLAPEESMIHNHNVFHFTGAREDILVLMNKLFNVSEEDVTSFLTK
ncbi:MAG: DUF6786 family protein [Bacteroidota bacterium]